MNSKIGLERGIVRLVPHNPEWKNIFEAEKLRLQNSISQYVLDIQHIGSTAIPGIVAKPIVDIGVAVENFERATVCVAPLEAIGYEYKGENGIPRRHYFDYGMPRIFHLHMFEQTSPEWQSHVLFRDYLVRHPEIAGQYEALKKDLAGKYRNEREKYTSEKGPFIQQVITAARQELASTPPPFNSGS